VELKNDEVELSVYLLGDTKNVEVKLTSNSDEGNFYFEINKNLYNKKFKTTKGYSFMANCTNPNTLVTIQVIDSKTKKVLNKESAYTLVKVSSK